jgi:hypothetical protein
VEAIMTSQQRPANPRGEAERRARERTLKRSKAVTAAAGFGGFASLVAVLIGHPVHSTASSSTTTDTTQSTSSTTDSTTTDSNATDDTTGSSGTTTTTVMPDTVTSGS